MPDPSYLDTAIQQVQTPEAQAFLDAIASPESHGQFNVRFNGNTPATFDDMSRHPQIPVVIPDGWPMAGSTSDAAGAYQMLGSTWRGAAKNLGLPGADTGDAPFYPLYQQLGAWDVANRAYKQVNPKGDLLDALQSGNIEPVMAAMRQTHQWDTASPQAYFGNLVQHLQTATNPIVSDAPVADVTPPAAASSTPSDGDLVKMFILGTLPGMQPPKQIATPSAGSQPIPTDAQASSTAIPTGIDALAAVGKPATSAPPVNGTGQPISQAQLSGAAPMPAPQAPAASSPTPASAATGGVDPNGMIKFYGDQLQALKGLPAQSDTTIGLQKAYADELSKWQGILQQQPAFQGQVAQAKHLGDTNQTIVNGQVQPLPGALDTTQQFAGASSEGTEGPKRLTQAVAPQQMRGAGASVVYPAGSPIATQYAGLKQANALPPNVDIDQSGSVTINNTNPSSETIGKNFETLDAMEKQANDARLAQYQAGLLKNTLNAIGTSGPLTQHLGDLSAMAQQAGVDPKVLAAINIPSAPNIQEANAVAKELLGSVLRATFPGRITNTDIATMSPSSPNVNMLNEASNYLIDKIILPKTQRDIARYGFATTLPQNDTQVFKKNLYDWDQNNSYDKFVAPPEGSAPPGTATPAAPSVYHNPKTGQIIELRNGQWVDQQTGQAVQ